MLPLPAFIEEYIRETTNGPDPDAVFDTMSQRLDRHAASRRGYLGWLTTNPQFLDEHERFFDAHWSDFDEVGLPTPPIPDEATIPPEWARSRSDEPFAMALRDFCDRWRLQSMVAPFLPQPLAPQFSSLLPAHAAQHSPSGARISVPDTFPIYSGDEVQRMVEDAVRGSGLPEHLAEWHEIAQAENVGKSRIGRFGRLFEIQHYTRILYQRHAEALNRKQGKLKEALASFLQVSPDSIHKDFIWLREQLGADWHSRGCDLLSR